MTREERPAGGRGDGTRERLLRAAAELFAEQGYAGTSLRQVIERAGVGNGAAVGYHFGSKEGLYAAVLERVLHPVLDALDEAVAAFERGEREPSLEAVVRAYVEPVVRVHLGAEGAVPSRLLAQLLTASSPGARVLARGRLGGSVDGVARVLGLALPGEPSALVRFRLRAITGVLVAFVAGLLDGAAPGEPAALVTERIVAFCVAGSRAPQPPPARSRRPVAAAR